MITTLVLLGSLLVPPFSDAIRSEDTSLTLPADGSRIVVIGDSITQAGDYVVYLEAFLLTRFPERSYPMINHGLSSETASGLSEPDHPDRRPWIHDRFDRDVTDWEPDVVLACYGMNDGIYHPFDPDRFQSYQDGILKLVSRVKNHANARIDLLTPPPFDPYRRQVSDPDAEHFGYRYPAADYDHVLARYADWLRSIAANDLLVVDVNGEFSSHVEARRSVRASFSVSPDGVHPNPTGHWLIAQALLKAWGVPGVVAEAHIDATAGRAESGEIDQLATDVGVVTFSWRSPLPMPIDPRCDSESLRLARVSDQLNSYRLRVDGLDEGHYRLFANAKGAAELPKLIGTFASEELAEGIDLTRLPAFPTVIAAQELLQVLLTHRLTQAAAWRESIREGMPPRIAPPGEDEEIMESIRLRSQPVELLLRIELVDQSEG